MSALMHPLDEHGRPLGIRHAVCGGDWKIVDLRATCGRCKVSTQVTYATHEIVDGEHGPDIICHAPQGADCRRKCSTGECDEWGGDLCGCGPLVDAETCAAVDWIEGFGIEDCGPQEDETVWDGTGDTLTYRGPVEVEYGDGYRWWPSATGQEASP